MKDETEKQILTKPDTQSEHHKTCPANGNKSPLPLALHPSMPLYEDCSDHYAKLEGSGCRHGMSKWYSWSSVYGLGFWGLGFRLWGLGA